MTMLFEERTVMLTGEVNSVRSRYVGFAFGRYSWTLLMTVREDVSEGAGEVRCHGGRKRRGEAIQGVA